MPVTAQLAMTRPDEARCEALFASGLQPSDAPDAGMVATAITRAVRQFGAGGCAGRMAQEFGDHPDAAASRMRWARQLLQAPSWSPGPGPAPADAGDRARAAVGPGPQPGRQDAASGRVAA
jgi:hypothetical protein